MTIKRVLKKLAEQGNADVSDQEIEEACTRSTAYALGYVYARTHIEQKYDPPSIEDAKERSGEGKSAYLSGWLDGHIINLSEEMGGRFAARTRSTVNRILLEEGPAAIARWLENQDAQLDEVEEHSF